MDQYLYTNIKPKYIQQQEYVPHNACENTRKTCNELIDSKIKLSVVNLKLWIITSVVMFLAGTGSTFACGIKSYGKIEEKVESISKNQEAQASQIEALRQEVWKLIPIGQHKQSGTQLEHQAQVQHGVYNNEQQYYDSFQEYQGGFLQCIARL